MSAYNLIRAIVECPSCKSEVDVQVQFKFGDTWQRQYALGDVLKWAGNDVGPRDVRHVVIDGAVEGPCPRCGFDGDWDVYVRLRNNRIDRVERADGRYDFVTARRTYIVLET